MKIQIDPKKLVAAIKAVREFQGEDSTREQLMAVYVEPTNEGISLTATDGYTLCQVSLACEVSGPAVLLENLEIDTLVLQAKGAIRLFLTSYEFDLKGADDLKFPAYERVIPAKVEADARVDALCSFNGLYLARIGHVQKTLKFPYPVIQLGNEGTAMRVDYKNEDFKAIVVIMSARLPKLEK